MRGLPERADFRPGQKGGEKEAKNEREISERLAQRKSESEATNKRKSCVAASGLGPETERVTHS